MSTEDQPKCENCGRALPERKRRGAARRYCHDACKQEAYRKRKASKANIQPDAQVVPAVGGQ